MIAKLTGRLDSLGEDWAIIDVGGVGYLVYCPARVLARLPAPGETVALVIETHVREDHIHLFGFLEPREREWFRLLSTVQGVGSKVALALLSVLSAEALGRAIAAGDKAALTQAAGVGARLAGRILSELADKAAALGSAPPPPPFGAAESGAAPGTPPEPTDFATSDDRDAAMARLLEDATSALANLGYGRSEAREAAATALSTLSALAAAAEGGEDGAAPPPLALEPLLAAALRALGREGR